ncbi:MAG: hypothetical protein NZ651_06000 [Candidatus Bipolaricaulota bacterium]|nr:hypothetical protein [Candidatus Bipolaricaulota bacterium]MDW8127305.1 hypothetical protein [Candidatus Bipolaricaulota bacterium]
MVREITAMKLSARIMTWRRLLRSTVGPAKEPKTTPGRTATRLAGPRTTAESGRLGQPLDEGKLRDVEKLRTDPKRENRLSQEAKLFSRTIPISRVFPAAQE